MCSNDVTAAIPNVILVVVVVVVVVVFINSAAVWLSYRNKNLSMQVTQI